jgi:hypothetical protein
MSVPERGLVDERPIPLGPSAGRERDADPRPHEAVPRAIVADHGEQAAAGVRAAADVPSADVVALAGHPLAAFRGFRMEVEVVEPAFRPARGCVGRLVLTYALVMALVLALIAAFVACAAHGGGAAA